MDKELKALLESYHVATLRQMAEAAALDVKQPGTRKNLNKTDLHALMLKEFFTPQRISASLEELDTRERAVLDRLLLRGGEATTRSLKRELARANLIDKTPKVERRRSYYYSNAGTYGMDVYEGSPKKRNSRIFEDVIARLTWLGLVFSKNPPATYSSSTPYKLKFHPSNHIFIPVAIRQHLPQPAPIPDDEEETWQPARVLPGSPTLFLRDLYLYWDFTRRRPVKLLNSGYVGKRDLKAVNAVLLQPDPQLPNAQNETNTPKLHLLRLLLQMLSLLEVQGITLRPANTDARKIPAFWTKSTPEQVADILHAWMSLSDYSFKELGNQAKQYAPDYVQGRKNVIAALKKYAAAGWTHQELFLEQLQDHNNDFLFPSRSQVENSRKSYYNSYIGGHYFYGSRSDLLQTFDKFESRFIAYLTQHTLHPLGIVDLAYGPGAEKTPAFKLTALGKSVLGVDTPADNLEETPAADTGKVILQPNFHLLAMGPVSLSTLAWLDLFTERQRADLGAFEYQITRDSVYHAQQLDMPVDSIIQWLTQATGQTLPQNVHRTLQEWGAHHKRIVFRSGVSLLQAANANLLEDLLETYQTGRYLSRALTPEVALLKKGKDNALVSALIDRGILPAVSGDQPQSADHSVHIEANGTITPVHAVPSLHLRGRLARLAEEQSDNRWQLTPASVRKNGGSKAKVLKMLDELRRLNRGDLPEAILTQVKAWGGYYGNAALETLTLIEFRDPEIMAELMQRPDLQGLLAPFSVENRALAVISPEKAGDIQDTLATLGMRVKDSLPR